MIAGRMTKDSFDYFCSTGKIDINNIHSGQHIESIIQMHYIGMNQSYFLNEQSKKNTENLPTNYRCCKDNNFLLKWLYWNTHN
jgi:hypothetical protein